VSGQEQRIGGGLKAIEKEAIRNALLQTDGNRKRAAEILGISLRSLHYKIKEYGIE
jgi:transcriptional regulator with PAS, ATPase and Fis domain